MIVNGGILYFISKLNNIFNFNRIKISRTGILNIGQKPLDQNQTTVLSKSQSELEIKI